MFWSFGAKKNFLNQQKYFVNSIKYFVDTATEFSFTKFFLITLRKIFGYYVFIRAKKTIDHLVEDLFIFIEIPFIVVKK